LIGKLFGECVLHGAGVGVVISPRDLSRERAVELAPQYRDLHADVMIDPRFYLPDSTVGRISAYASSKDLRGKLKAAIGRRCVSAPWLVHGESCYGFTHADDGDIGWCRGSCLLYLSTANGKLPRYAEIPLKRR